MSQCPYCRTSLPGGATVCYACGARSEKAYLTIGEIKFCVFFGLFSSIPTGITVAFLTNSPVLAMTCVFLLVVGPGMYLKMKRKNKITWVRK